MAAPTDVPRPSAKKFNIPPLSFHSVPRSSSWLGANSGANRTRAACHHFVSVQNNLATARVSLARHHTKTLFSFAISAGGSGSTHSYAEIERGLAVNKT